MNESKTNQLLAAARREAIPEVPVSFSRQVVSALRNNTSGAPLSSAIDTLSELFPRFALAALLIISVCVAMEVYLERTNDYASAAEQWFFNAE